MNQEVASVLVAIAAMWIVLTGIAWMTGGPRRAAALNSWALRSLFHLVRAIIGGLLVWIGTQIRGRRAPPRP